MAQDTTRKFSVITDGLPSQLPDIDPSETSEWLESLDAVIEESGRGRARFLMLKLLERAREKAVGVPGLTSTDFINTIPPEQEPWFPGDEHVERRIRAYIRWNAAIMVSRANRPEYNVGGHIATYASSASLYEVGFNHFFRGKDHLTSSPGSDSGDQIFIQGHASPGIYARAFLEGRLTEAQLDAFRREGEPGGLSSYPHPRLMPDFWEFPTVSMGLGPIDAIYQARFNRYLLNRQIKDTSRSKVWAFLGDGEMDEPESIGALGVAAREELDNLIFVVNCNLQRLDGPVRGNGKIMQELESLFRGAGWNVIKVVWGRDWDPLLAKDTDGVLVHRMNTTPDGQFQTYSTSSGDYIREHFFGADARLRRMVANLADEDLSKLSRGGHDYRKLYAAYKAATEHAGQPTVILAHTIKGWTLGKDFEGRNATHQMKKLTKTELKELRDRLYLEIPDSALDGNLPPYYRPGPDSEEIQYMRERRAGLGGSIPRRVVRARTLPQPPKSIFDELRRGSGKQPVATTMAIVRLLKDLMKTKEMGARFVPVIPDEARTFGMDAMFPTAKIYSPHGQRYEAVDRELLLSYRESESGQMLHEGISEAGSMGSVIAAATAYSTHGQHMIPVYVFYSMFGFQRTGDQMWALGDQLGRAFLLGATAGRTTLNGEGLQHQDGHSLLLASTNPACVSYDPAFAFEISHIVRDALDRMYGERNENVFYYLTVYNEPVPQPAEPAGVDPAQIIAGMYRFRTADALTGGEGTPARPVEGGAAESSTTAQAQLLASGTGMRWALAAQEMLAADYGIAADVWSVTSWNELRREALVCERRNLLNPEQPPAVPYVSQILDGAPGPVVAVSDWMRAVPDQISRWVPQQYTSLGTDGFGRSDTRAALRRHFNVDAESVVVATLEALARTGDVEQATVDDAIRRYGLRKDGAGEAALGSGAVEEDDQPVSG
ncbi:pyruvate dehydrogenase (acetyl-transferring), homodimeric type [Frankia sp. Mgl5]|uniref:pyruvate dehydrogenase (acetyl-transferring), homodimeric type n=1 Tax=Frankia sp. Mgl5 TaxID=2933793 RepID=UPI0027E3DD63|nr:pyruvate dehydrogenase (acetyl-transferring), homodimeric type [Frankia sp. Mgl5]